MFLDVSNLGASHFDIQLLDEIGKVPNFILILSSNSLDRCKNEDDWLRYEIKHAIQTKRNIIPVFLDGFVMPKQKDLPSDIADLIRFQSVKYDHVLFEESMNTIMKYLV